MYKPAFLAVAVATLLLGVVMFATAAPIPAPIPAPEPAPAASASDEGELLRQIKNDVFDQKWDAVLAGCSQFITQYPRSSDLSRAYYYRAQALEHSKAREAEAITAYSDFVTRFPGETGAMREDALLSRITLSTALYLKGNKSQIGIILQGMDERGYPGIFAAVQASKIDHGPARAKALPILLRCAGSESDAELRNECLLGVLRIDPQKSKDIPGQGPATPATPTPPTVRIVDGKLVTPLPPAAAAGEPVKLIRVEVYDKVKKKVSVQVNMPVAFAEVLLDSLSDELRNQIDDALKHKGVALERFWDSFKKAGKQTIVEIDDETEHIKVWVE